MPWFGALLLAIAPLGVVAQAQDLIFGAQFEDPPPASDQSITLTPSGSVGSSELVSLGIPFAPGVLTDATRLRILAESGDEVAAFAKPTLRWHWRDNSIRAVKVQFYASPTGRYRFDFGTPRSRSMAERPYDEGTRPGKEGAPIPRVVATLAATWLTASQIAGPQLVADPTRPYDQFIARQWQWARNTAYVGVHGFLFDRASAVGFQYVRSGDPAYFLEFYNSATFYLSKIKTTGAGGGWPDCTGGWKFDGVNECDSKYSYVTPQLLLLGLAGDDTRLTPATVRTMVQNQVRGGWNLPLQRYVTRDQVWTERQIGLALEHIVSGYEITGDAAMRQNILDVVGWLHEHQQSSPAGDAYTGGWTHSWTKHECPGCAYDAATDTRGASPWMSANIIGGLWRAWRATEDARIPAMIRSFGDYMERHGWIGADGFAAGGATWRASCNVDGAIAWYFSSGVEPLAKIATIQNSEGWYSDSHNPELYFVVAAAHFFETDAGKRAALRTRAEQVARYFNVGCGSLSGTPRAFNWQHRNPEAVWLLAQ
jgi:hypothetical protein